jgi:uncharacterized protein YggE
MDGFVRHVLGAAAAAAVLGAPVMAQAQMAPATQPQLLDGTLLTISAQGETNIAPDLATITIGVVTQGGNAQAALSANATKMNAVVAAIKGAGVADKDVQTSNLSVNPQYQYTDGQPPRLTRYEARNNVTVKVRDLKNVGKVVDSVVAVGSNEVNGISFGLDDDAKAMDQARTDAMKKARARADLYAAAAGLKVNRIVSISEGGGAGPVYPVMVTAARMAANAPTPVAPGELSIASDVTVVYLLK